MSEVKILNAGESALVVEFGDTIDPLINAKVGRLNTLLHQANITGITETVPTYRSLLIYFEPLVLSKAQLQKQLEQFWPHLEGVNTLQNGRLVHIPVCYDDEFAPDLAAVCKHTGLSTAEVIRRHTQPEYLVYMIGFMAGFPYLGGMDSALATPRLKQPRTEIPAGAVGIADKQTGIYPVVSPGGWQLIGRTPVPVYNPAADNPFLFAPGDYLKFVSVSEAEYRQIALAVAAGVYKCVCSESGGENNA